MTGAERPAAMALPRLAIIRSNGVISVELSVAINAWRSAQLKGASWVACLACATTLNPAEDIDAITVHDLAQLMVIDSTGQHSKPNGKPQYVAIARWPNKDIGTAFSDRVAELVRAQYPADLE